MRLCETTIRHPGSRSIAGRKIRKKVFSEYFNVPEEIAVSLLLHSPILHVFPWILL